jgi:hypothetical protein
MKVEFSSPIPDRTAPKGRDKNLPGDKYGRLTLMSACEKVHYKPQKWVVLCDCGSIMHVQTSNCRNGHTNSCGCYRRDASRDAHFTHGKSKTPLYKVWDSMWHRCTNTNNKSFVRYGGRGVTVCEQWSTFEGFFADMGHSYSPGLTLERKDNCRNYDPSNVVWATRAVQNNNTRRNVFYSYRGKNLTRAQCAKILGVTGEMLRKRLKRGWSVADAFGPEFGDPLL